jgi:hypothetical protein
METTQVSYTSLMSGSRFIYTGLQFSQTFNFVLDLQIQLQLFHYTKFAFYLHIFICTRQAILCGEACRHVDMPLHTIQHEKRMTVCCRITTLEDSHFDSDFNQDQKAP